MDAADTWRSLSRVEQTSYMSAAALYEKYIAWCRKRGGPAFVRSLSEMYGREAVLDEEQMRRVEQLSCMTILDGRIVDESPDDQNLLVYVKHYSAVVRWINISGYHFPVRSVRAMFGPEPSFTDEQLAHVQHAHLGVTPSLPHADGLATLLEE